MSNRKRSNMQPARPQLPPIVAEDDGQLPFFKQDFFSDVALLVSTDEPSTRHGSRKTQNLTSSGRKLYTSRCILAYNSPVFEKMLGNAKKHDLDLSHKNGDDIVELMCYLDPRVPYTITAQSAKQLLPLAEEYEMHRLRKQCEKTIYTTYINLRKEYANGEIPSEINDEYLLLADRYGINDLVQMCVDEYVSNSGVAMAKVAVNSDSLSEKVKLLILKKKLSKLNSTLEKERRHKVEAEMKANRLQPKASWHKYWHVDEGPATKHRPAQGAKQLLPLAEEYKMFKLRRICENALYAAFEKLRKEYRLGHIPSEINEEYLIMADRYNLHDLLLMCVDEHVNCCAQDMTKSLVHSDALSEGVKMMILQKTLAKLNAALEKERKYRSDVEYKLGNVSHRKTWTNKFELY